GEGPGDALRQAAKPHRARTTPLLALVRPQQGNAARGPPPGEIDVLKKGDTVRPTPSVADTARSAAPSGAPRPACRNTTVAGRQNHGGRRDIARSHRRSRPAQIGYGARRPSATEPSCRARRKQCIAHLSPCPTTDADS